MEKRLKVNGFIEYPEGADLPALGEKVTATIVGEVTADGTKRTKYADGKIATTVTHTVTMDSDSSKVTHVEEADESQESLAV